jgi:hypothetical protein
MEYFILLLKEINIMQIFIIFAGMGFFYNRLDAKIDKFDKKIDDSVETLNKRIDHLSDCLSDVDRRLCRIEGSLQVHGHCLFNQQKPDRKAE